MTFPGVLPSMGRRVLILVALIPACAADEPSTLSDTSTLIGKCTFSGSAPTLIQPGEIFLYAAFDAADGTYAVVTNTAQRDDSLLDRTVIQDLAPAYPATVARNSLEFGGDKYIGTGNRTGELHVTGGRTFDTDLVYPSCVFWPD